jgi:cell division protein FtsQ
VARVRQAVETLPWVAAASVRRRWPDTLVIGTTERVAVARWNDGLMSDGGIVFAPRPETFPDALPVLQGPPGSASAVWTRFRRLREIFGRAGLRIARLSMDERRAWTAVLTDDVVVQLGVDQTDDAAAERFVRALPHIGAPADARLARVDLRYPNGFALAWSQTTPQSPGKQ